RAPDDRQIRSGVTDRDLRLPPRRHLLTSLLTPFSPGSWPGYPARDSGLSSHRCTLWAHGSDRHAPQHPACPARLRQPAAAPRPPARLRCCGDASGGGLRRRRSSALGGRGVAKERFPGPGPFFKATLQTHETEELCELLQRGHVLQCGLIPWGSNYTFL